MLYLNYVQDTHYGNTTITVDLIFREESYEIEEAMRQFTTLIQSEI